MPDTNIAGAVSSDLTAREVDYSVDAQQTEAGGDQKEYTYQNTNFGLWLGYYKTIPELKIAIDTKANWVVGNGYKAEETTMLLLDTIKGNGKDSFNSILENMERTCYIAEDAYAEVIRDPKNNDVLINLKPLDPSTIVKVFDDKARIKRYEQTSKVKGKKNKKFAPDEIFELSHNRMADDTHGESIIPALQNIIDMRNEAMADWKTVLHRNVQPVWIYHLDTDDEAEIAAFKRKNDAARAKGENMYVPKGVVVPELVATATNASLNPITWIENLNNYFFQAVGVPQIIVGNAKAFTDASGKIVYLAFEQRIRGRQLYVEEQVLSQLNLVINLTFPASLQQDTVSDTTSEVEEEPQEPAAQPNDTTEELEGQT